jgi:hypothetical protein
VIVSSQGIREPLRHHGLVSLLIDGDDNELGSLGAAYVDQVPTFEIAHEDGSALAGLVAPGRVRTRDASGDLELGIEGSPDSLSVALGSMIGYEHFGAWRM